MNTLKDLIRDLEDFSTQHLQINSFLYGFDDIISTKDIEYPLMYVKIDSNSSISEQNSYKCSIKILELCRTDNENSLDIVNNMEQITNDIVSYYFEGKNFELNERNVNGKPLFNIQDDNLDGYQINVEFISRKSLNKCYIPGFIQPLKCLVEVEEVPERAIEPFLYNIDISTENGTAPFTILDTELQKDCNEDNSIIGIVNNIGSTADYSINGDEIYYNITTYVNANYPSLNINHGILYEIGERVRIEFDYDTDVFDALVRFKMYNGTYNYFKFEGQGHYVWEFIADYDDTHSIFIAGRTSDISEMHISNFQIFFPDRIVPEQPFFPQTKRTFGDYSFTVQDSKGEECTQNISIVVPTPDASLKISVDDRELTTGFNTSTRVYQQSSWGDGNIYVNWGDGEIELYDNPNGYIYLNHNYAPEFMNTTKNIDIYGDGLRYIYLYQGSRVWVTPQWHNKFPYTNFSTTEHTPGIYIYRGAFVGSFNELNNSPGRFYHWYNTESSGDIGKLKDSYLYYNLLYYTYKYGTSNYNKGIYGDVGTFLKGNIIYQGLSQEGYRKGQTYIYGANLTYTDRLDKPLYLSTYMYIRGYSDNINYWALSTPNETAQLIVDLDTWLVRTMPPVLLNFTNSASPNDADEPLHSEFLAAKANLIADGYTVSHS